MKKLFKWILIVVVLIAVFQLGRGLQKKETSLEGSHAWGELAGAITQTKPEQLELEQPETEEATETSVETTTDETFPVAEVIETTTETLPESIAAGIRPEIKEALDSYEELMVEYVDFMKRYAQSDYEIGLLIEYGQYMEKYEKACRKWEEIDEAELNHAELAYYIDVTTRVNKKLLELSEE